MMAVEEVLKMMDEEGQGIWRNHGGRFIRQQNELIDYDEDDEIWPEKYVDSKHYLSDFQSFIINVLLYKLSRVLGFDSVLLLSWTGKYIFLLIRSDDKDLKKLAQSQEY